MYVIVALVNDCRYFIQDYKGQYLLNGLQENAKKYPNMLRAYHAIGRIKKTTNIKAKLSPMEVPPKS